MNAALCAERDSLGQESEIVWRIMVRTRRGFGQIYIRRLASAQVVVGVAKSTRLLFVTAAGMNPECAAEHIRSMHGFTASLRLIRQ